MKAILMTVFVGFLGAALLLPLGTRLVSAQSPAGPQGGTGPQQQGAPPVEPKPAPPAASRQERRRVPC